eukprot:scaffold305862_cov24-Attheya_sp.AAC.1
MQLEDKIGGSIMFVASNYWSNLKSKDLLWNSKMFQSPVLFVVVLIKTGKRRSATGNEHEPEHNKRSSTGQPPIRFNNTQHTSTSPHPPLVSWPRSLPQ